MIFYKNLANKLENICHYFNELMLGKKYMDLSLFDNYLINSISLWVFNLILSQFSNYV